jgi:hypothetical protein
VSPNPANDYIVISYEIEMAKVGHTIELIDFHGNRLNVFDLNNRKDQFIINVKDLKAGIYVITLKKNGKFMESVKFTVIN